MSALSAARGVPGVKDQTPDSRVTSLFAYVPRRRAATALGRPRPPRGNGHRGCARTVHPRDDDACGVDCGWRDGRDQLLLRRTRARPPASTSPLFAINAFDG